MIYKNEHLKKFEKDFEKQFNDYRDEDLEGKEKINNEKLRKFPIHQLLKQIKIDELLWDIDGNSLYPSTMRVQNGIYPRIETRYAFTRDMNDELVEYCYSK